MSILIGVGALFGVVVVVVARQKGRSEFCRFLEDFLFHTIGSIVLLLGPVLRAGITNECAACAVVVKGEAQVRRFCGRVFATVERAEVS
jgi:hypothetical protein